MILYTSLTFSIDIARLLTTAIILNISTINVEEYLYGKTHSSSCVSPFLSHYYHTVLLTPGVWVFHTSSNSPNQLGVLQFNSVLTSLPELESDITS